MKSVQILLSSYNGEKYIKRQIDSILAQEGVDVHLFIRDDGSKDGTVSIIQRYAEKYPDRVEVVLGKNLGYKKSFLTLIQLAGDYDYYAFADQDDYWLPDKEMCSINKMEATPNDCAKLVQVNLAFADESLNLLNPQPKYHDLAIPTHDEIYAGDFFQGCLMTWNYKAMCLFKSYMPVGDYSHDHWIGTVCFLLGQVYHIDEPKIYYVRHGDNVSITGNRKSERLKRLKDFYHGKEHVYNNRGKDLLDGYRDELSKHDIQICEDFVNYKHSLPAKMRLLFNLNLRRPSLLGSVFYKLNILLNRV